VAGGCLRMVKVRERLPQDGARQHHRASSPSLFPQPLVFMPVRSPPPVASSIGNSPCGIVGRMLRKDCIMGRFWEKFLEKPRR
jgi:hypothetical protein